MFRVEWVQEALDELTTAWLKASGKEREAITGACQEAEARLKRDPQSEGESRSGNRRFAFMPPLAIDFQIDFGDQIVSILQVRVYRPRAK